jgi:DNA (cytosine-5)-methyltransferase 1
VHFNPLIRQITAVGYSVRWKISHLDRYGNYQARRRLIIVAACPGEDLPRFPEETHGPSKKPFATIAEALSKTESVRTPENMRHCSEKLERGYYANIPLRAAITCSGGTANLHPSGRRTFNLFELAALQSFPPRHKFFGTQGSIKKQIGNAVPAVFAKTLFSQIIKSLERSDRRIARYRPDVVELE